MTQIYKLYLSVFGYKVKRVDGDFFLTKKRRKRLYVIWKKTSKGLEYVYSSSSHRLVLFVWNVLLGGK